MTEPVESTEDTAAENVEASPAEQAEEAVADDGE